LCSHCSRPITSPPVSTAECRRAFGEVLQPLASGHRCHRCHHFWRGFESMVGTRTGVLPCLWCGLKGAPLYLGDSGDGDDAHERGHLRAYSRQGAPLLRRLSYPFNLTRRTRRTKQRVPYLCSFSTYAWYRVFSNCLITRRRHPTRRMIPRRVGREHRRAATRTRRLQTPYLCRILRPSSGSSGFVETWEPPTGNAGVVL
jgi:hypothetical protein